MRISDWSSDVCSSDLLVRDLQLRRVGKLRGVLPEGGELVRVLTEQREERRHIRTDEVVDRHRQEDLQRAQLLHRLVVGIADPLVHVDQEDPGREAVEDRARSEEHTSELQSLMRISYAVFCLKKKNKHNRSN